MNHLTPPCSSGTPVAMPTTHATPVTTKTTTLKFTAVAIAVLAITGCSRFSLPGSSSMGDLEDSVIAEREHFSKKVYASVGVGASNLNPDTSANATFDVNDSIRPAED